jgi:integrase
MPLTDVKVRNAKPGEKQVKLSDSGGMYLLITSKGGKCWRFKYRFGGKEKVLALGTYPEISLTDARQRRDDARKLVANGADPGDVKKAQKAAKTESNANSFEVIAREWFNKFSTNWAPTHSSKIKGRLENDLFPWLGSRPISEIKAPELLSVIRKIEERGALDTAHRVKMDCGRVFRYAIATGRADRDPSADLRGAIPLPKAGHFASITDPKLVAPLLRAIDDFQCSIVVKSALKLAPLVFVRPGELRKAEWSEIDLDAAEWNIPGSKMKMKEPHLVPLSSQAVYILRELHPLTGSGKYVFPNLRSPLRPMSDVAILAALRRMGFDKDEISVHGFRAMARTILDEVLGFRPDFIEHQLAHAVKDPNGRAYNRTAHLVERKKMMQLWADYLDGLKVGAKVIPLKRTA